MKLINRIALVTGGDVQTILGCQGRPFAQTPQLLISAHRAFAVNSVGTQGRFGIRGRA